MKVETLAIPEVKLITPPRFGDSRGFFSETYNERKLREAAGITDAFVQDNHSLSVERGVIRGLHCQLAPSIQGKLVRCVRGAIWDVAVDARVGSPTFGKWVAAELSAENWQQLWVPGGFVHAFCTLEANTEVMYKVTAEYDKAAEAGVIWNDPDIGLPWPIAPEEAILSDKDKLLPRLRDAGTLFTYQGPGA
ncbi:dTDP-4-dehydrorhamnose 3,5-epimerase [Acidisoma sp. C75]